MVVIGWLFQNVPGSNAPLQDGAYGQHCASWRCGILGNDLCRMCLFITGTGCIVISPTRELSMQTFGVLKELMKYHHHTYGLIMGGANRQTEAQKLSKGGYGVHSQCWDSCSVESVTWFCC
jgi:hypothetical protein